MARSSACISLGAKRCTPGSGRFARRSENKLRRGQQVAQIMIDLGHREAERGEPVLLMQHRGELGLHGRELALGDADLVGAAGRHDDAVGVFRIGAERHHVAGDPAHRPHEQVMQRPDRPAPRRCRMISSDSSSRIRRIAQHRLAQRRLVHDELDEFAAHRRRADHAHHVISCSSSIVLNASTIDIEGVDVAHVEVVGDRRRRDVADR